MKKIALIFVLLLPCFLIAQEWNFDDDFTFGPAPHGIVVTPDGKIWVGYFGVSDTLSTDDGQELPYRPIWIYNPDGSLFTKIQFLTYNSKTDTLFNTCRGMSLDNNGNVLYTYWDRLWRINYQTHEAMNMVVPEEGVSLTEAVCDDNGFIYLTYVVPGGRPFHIYDQDFNLVNHVLDECNTIQRAMVVTPDGEDLFLGRIYGGDEGNGIIHYHSDTGPLGTYTAEDTIHQEIWGQCVDMDNKGLIWVGSYWDVGVDDLDGWYALDPENDFEIVYSIGFNAGVPTGIEPEDGGFHAPRGTAWNEEGTVMYTADFDGHVIKQWSWSEGGFPTTHYDIWGMDFITGIKFQISNIKDAGEFNPSWSPKMTKVAYDVVGGPAAQGHAIYVSDLKFGTTDLLEGAEGGNDASWSPNGKMIAFDRSVLGDPNVYYVPSGGGNPVLVVEDALDPEWSPTSQYLVFWRPSDYSIRTIRKDGSNEKIVGYGTDPTWAMKGGFIAFIDWGNIWKVPVTGNGMAIGQPVQLTFNDNWKSKPTVSKDGTTIAFATDFDGEYDIWMIPVDGGMPEFVTGHPSQGDYDPAFSKIGKLLAYAAYDLPYMAKDKGNPLDISSLPNLLSLSQNFPNPFNPTTEIRFELPEPMFVTLKIYNTIGQEIRTVVEGYFSQGLHQVMWNGKDKFDNNVASGIYFYQLHADEQVLVKKMNLVR